MLSDDLITIDPLTGAGTRVGAVGFGFIDAMDFSPDGILYAVNDEDGPSKLLTINTSTGAGTLIGNIGFNWVTGLAFTQDGFLFGISDLLNALGNAGTGQLIQIDPLTGIGTAIDTVITSGNMDGMVNVSSSVPEPLTFLLLLTGTSALAMKKYILNTLK